MSYFGYLNVILGSIILLEILNFSHCWICPDLCGCWACKMQCLLKHMAWCCHSRSLLSQLLVGLLICFWLASSSFNIVFHWIVLVYSNGCFSEWLKRSQEKHTSVLCPQCRAVVQFVGRNHYLLNIAEVISYLSI